MNALLERAQAQLAPTEALCLLFDGLGPWGRHVAVSGRAEDQPAARASLAAAIRSLDGGPICDRLCELMYLLCTRADERLHTQPPSPMFPWESEHLDDRCEHCMLLDYVRSELGRLLPNIPAPLPA